MGTSTAPAPIHTDTDVLVIGAGGAVTERGPPHVIVTQWKSFIRQGRSSFNGE
jgi:hypothetical protein